VTAELQHHKGHVYQSNSGSGQGAASLTPAEIRQGRRTSALSQTGDQEVRVESSEAYALSACVFVCTRARGA